MSLVVEMFMTTSPVMAHPYVVFVAPPGYKVVGGGAKDNWSGKGNMLTASYPLDYANWVVTGKDHVDSDPASITAYLLAISDPNDEWDVTIVSETSEPAHSPEAAAWLPPGYVLTGGGGLVSYGTGAGNLLTASYPYPVGGIGWEARSKDHLVSDPCSITAYVVGIKSLTGKTVTNIVRQATSPVASHPSAHVNLDPGYMLTCGGAFDNWQGEGNLLTGCYPDGDGWTATGKDHLESSPAAITAYAVGIQST